MGEQVTGWTLRTDEHGRVSSVEGARLSGCEAVPVVDARLTPEAVEKGARVLATGRFGARYEPSDDDRDKARAVALALGFRDESGGSA